MNTLNSSAKFNSHHFTWILAVPIWLCALVFLYWNFIETDCPIKPVGSPDTPMVYQQVPQGGTLLTERKYTMALQGEVTLYRKIIDHVVYTLPPVVVAIEKGIHDDHTMVEIPPVLPPGLYVYTLRACYRNNPVTTSCVDFQNYSFYVLNKDGSVPVVQNSKPPLG
jgi:hypothetical protein